jgi:hypothetical protein
MRNKLFFLAVFSLGFFSCKKNDSNPSGGTTKTTLVSQQSWKFDNAGLDPDKNGTIDLDISGQIPVYITDNTISFTSAGSGSVDEGTTKNNLTDPQTIPFTWSFASNETLININGAAIAGKGGQYKIVTLSSTKFTLSKDTTVPLIGATAFIVNLKH